MTESLFDRAQAGFNKLKNNLNQTKEKITNSVANGWDRLMHTRAGIFAEETIAEVSIIAGAVKGAVENVKSFGKGVSEAYKEKVDQNIFQRIGNVISTGVENIKEKIGNLRENVAEKIDDLTYRYRGLGVKDGADAIVEDAVDSIKKFGLFTAAMFEAVKVSDVQQRAEKVKDSSRLEVIDTSLKHIRKRGANFLKRALVINKRLDDVVDARKALAAIKRSNKLTTAGVTA